MGLAALVLPDEYGATSAVLAALLAFLLVTALVVFVAVPGPGTLDTLSHSVPLAGAVLVVAVLLLLSTDAALRWLWVLIAAGRGRLDRVGRVADPTIRALTGATDCAAWICPGRCTCPPTTASRRPP